jgi:hypothetical protein
MRYLVILDAQSVVGSTYAAGNNDGFVGDNPVLDCTEIQTDSPYYLFAKRDLSKQGGSHQSVFVPHGAVVMIACYEDQGPKLLGFTVSIRKKD